MHETYVAAIDKDADSDFGVRFPEVPGCFSAGATFEEARAAAERALAAHFAFLAEEGDPIPAPRGLETVAAMLAAEEADPDWPDDAGPSVLVAVPAPPPKGKALRVNVTVDEYLLADIDRAAAAEGLTRAAWLAAAARERLAGDRAALLTDIRLAVSEGLRCAASCEDGNTVG